MNTEIITKEENLTLIMNEQKYTYSIETASGEIEDIHLTFGIDTPLFQYFENLFNDWFEYQRRDIKEMYESDEAIYYKKGAIRGSIEILEEYIRENNLRYLNLDKENFKIDIECAWQ
jgi:hypothetical protein